MTVSINPSLLRSRYLHRLATFLAKGVAAHFQTTFLSRFHLSATVPFFRTVSHQIILLHAIQL